MPLLGLLLPMLLGLAICWPIVSDVPFLVRLALAYGLGLGLLTLAMFFLNVFGMRFSLVNTTVLVSLVIAVVLGTRGERNWRGFFWAIRVDPFRRTREFVSSLSIFEKVLLALLIFFLFSHLVIGVYWPVFRSDSLTLYDLRAKFLLVEQSFPAAVAKFQDKLVNMDWTLPVFAHAPMTSLIHTWLYLCGWESPKLFYPLLFVSMAVLFYHFLRDYVPRYHALLFTLVLVTIPFIYVYAASSYPHVAVAFYFSVGTFYLYRWIRVQKWGFLLLSGIFIGLSSWVRQVSGIFFLGYLVILLYVAVSRRRFLGPILFCATSFSIYSLWNIYAENVLHLTGGIAPPISQSVVYIKNMAVFLNGEKWRNVVNWLWNVALIGFRPVHYLLVLTVILYATRVWRHRFMLLIVLSNLALFLAGTYLASLTRAPQSHISSVQRLYIMFLPIIWYFIALATAEPPCKEEENSG